ncbi:MAG: SMP-30/gluconolactonase/LRE family protein [Gemmatimonadaceae bacterium]
MRLLSAIVACGALAACTSVSEKSAIKSDSARVADSTANVAATAGPSGPAVIAAVDGFKTPESVRYDSAADVYYVSNIDGNPNAHDGNGFISRMKPDGSVDSLRFIAGGRGGVTLDAPKGIILVGDTLWVTDIDAVRAFNKKTGAPIATVDLKPMHAVFLNDLAQGPDGAIYITDTGIRFGTSANPDHPGPDRIFRLAGRKVTVAAHGDTLGRPNGIVWDAANNRFIVGGFGTKNIFAWKAGDSAPTVIAAGAGGYDGLDVLPDGRVLISSWADSSVSIITGTTVTRLISGVSAPADFGIDTKRRRIAIPRFDKDRVELWALPAR